MTRPRPYPVLACIALLGATIAPAEADVWDAGASTHDNTPLATRNELVHGLEQVHDLSAREGMPDEDYYVVGQATASFEAIVDSASADVGGLFSASNFVRLASDGVTVVQQSSPTWGFLGNPGFSRVLRWREGLFGTGFTSYLRVRSLCGAACTSQDTYRIRFYDTTMAISRYNNSGTQSTVLIVQNPTQRPVSGEIYFLGGSSPNRFLFTLPFQIPRFDSLVLNSATIPELQGRVGSIIVTHDAGYGELAGKAVSIEPATGFVFESALVHRPH